MSVTVQEPTPARGSLLSRVPGAFAMFFGALGVFCVVLSLIPPLRLVLRPVALFLDRVTVPVSANLAYAAFLLLLAAAIGARKKAAWWLVVGYLTLLLITDVLVLIFDKD
ncbi:hypothetical protein HRW11_36205, partial [Streptomyces lunaelactis]